jgi:hypothetical protein
MKIPTYNFDNAYLYEIVFRTDMKLKFFISYSRSVKEDVRAVIELLRKTGHEVWWDADIPVIADWWATILDNIEWCDVFIFIVSEKSVQSPYCLAELKYATERKRPILPFLIDDHTRYTLPPEVTPMRNQWLKYDGIPANMLAEIIRSCSLIQWEKFQDRPFARPLEPNTGSSTLVKQFQQANDLAKAGHFDEAKKRLSNIASIDNKKWGQRCENWIRRLNLYAEIVELAEHEATLEFARESWQDYLALKDGLDFDPFDIAAKVKRTSTKTHGNQVVTPLSKPRQSQTTKQQEEDDDDAWLREFASIQPQLPTQQTLQTPYFDISLFPFDLKKIPQGDVIIRGSGELVPFSSTLGLHQSKSSPRLIRKKTKIIATFDIAKYPVTNAQFARFIEAGGYKNKNWWTDAGWEVRNKHKWIEPRYWNDSEWNGALQPVVGVSWYEAVAFCLWLSHETGLSIMLPTDQQWQRAAQGDDGRSYPWGNGWDSSRCNNNVDSKGIGITTPVIQYEGKNKGDSYFDVVDMAGNVSEWCRTMYPTGSNDISGTDNRVLFGGSWEDIYSDYFFCDFYLISDPNSRNHISGFRFVRNL